MKFTESKSLVTDDIDFAVTSAPIINSANGQTIPGFFANYRQDTGESLGIVKSRYKIFQHRDILSAFQEMYIGKITDDNFLVKNELRKGRVLTKVLFPNKTIGFSKNESYLGLTLKNSYDGSSHLEIQAGLMRIICMNGMTRDGYRIGDIQISHTIHRQFIPENMNNIFSTFKTMEGDYVTLVESLSKKPVISNLPEKIFSKNLINLARKAWPIEYSISGENNALTQYNAFTRVLSHKNIDPQRIDTLTSTITNFFMTAAIS